MPAETETITVATRSAATAHVSPTQVIPHVGSAAQSKAGLVTSVKASLESKGTLAASAHRLVTGLKGTLKFFGGFRIPLGRASETTQERASTTPHAKSPTGTTPEAAHKGTSSRAEHSPHAASKASAHSPAAHPPGHVAAAKMGAHTAAALKAGGVVHTVVSAINLSTAAKATIVAGLGISGVLLAAHAGVPAAAAAVSFLPGSAHAHALVSVTGTQEGASVKIGISGGSSISINL